MTRPEHFKLMARYNQWMNEKLFAAAATLADEELRADQKAFFGSIFNTLNHIVVADTIWLKRFTQHASKWPSLAPVSKLPDPQGLTQVQFAHFNELARHRQMLDQLIIDWAGELSDADLDVTLHYVNTAGVQGRRNFYGLLTHFFNHQTHHRGQASTLLSQASVDIGVTDLLALVPNESA
jgi:uncharacterized damage-inducible protein DinB